MTENRPAEAAGADDCGESCCTPGSSRHEEGSDVIAQPARRLEEVVRHLEEATAARKCWSCGCLHDSLATVERAVSDGDRSHELTDVLARAKGRLRPRRYDCLGCAICFPAQAMNELGAFTGDELAASCPVDEATAREGWPPLPGDYVVLRYGAPVAICTLNDDKLMQDIAGRAADGVSVVGTLHTENLGIERLVQNVAGNPNIRFLILAGPDSEQKVGHLPGQSLLALARNGIDERGRIIGAPGKRPLIRNADASVIDHFRRTVEVIDRVGEREVDSLVSVAGECAARDPGPSTRLEQPVIIDRVTGQLPDRTIQDPNGYFVVYPDSRRALISLEHYYNNGVLDCIIEGAHPAELYLAAIERNLLSRLDHAAYLGRELARAEESLRSDERYVQDAAPEMPTQSQQ